jgi:hypothetical protein
VLKSEWQALVSRFLEGEMDAPAFETAFIRAYNMARLPGDVPYTMDLLFYEVDAYCADPALRGPEDIDDVQLKAAARALVARIDEPWPRPSGTVTSVPEGL